MKPETLKTLLDWVRDNLRRELCPPEIRWRTALNFPQFHITVRGYEMDAFLFADEEIDAAIEAIDIKGNIASPDGPPQWTSSDETVATVKAAEDGMSAVIVATGKAGNAQITHKGDADLGDGVREISGVINLTVRALEAVAFRATLGAPRKQSVPEPQPEPTPEPQPEPSPQPAGDPAAPPDPMNTPIPSPGAVL